MRGRPSPANPGRALLGGVVAGPVGSIAGAALGPLLEPPAVSALRLLDYLFEQPMINVTGKGTTSTDAQRWLALVGSLEDH
jgi:hypothetical protein